MSQTTTESKEVSPSVKMPGRVSYPSMRSHIPNNSLPHSIAQWNRDKQALDQKLIGLEPEYWLIHDGVYDLRPYLDKHPGGRIWLEKTKGTDCTAAFEAHHLDSVKVEAILNKYLIRKVTKEKAAAAACFTYDKDGFYQSLKARAHQVLKNNGGTSGTTWMYTLCTLILLGWFFALRLVCTVESFTSAMIISVFAGWLLNTLMGIGHNFFHRKSLWRFAFDLSLFSSDEWRVSHAISHHLHPNCDNDVEASAIEPHMSFMRNRPQKLGIFVYPLWFIVHFFLGPIFILIRLTNVFLRKEEHYLPEHALAFIELIAFVLFRASVNEGLVCWLIMHGISTTLLIVMSTPVHRSEYSWTEGCPGGSTDFGVHQVITTKDYMLETPGYGHGLALRLFLGAGFSSHIVHHLFPTIDVSKHYLIEPILEEEAERFGIDLDRQPFLELLKSTFRSLWRGDSLGYKAPNMDCVKAQ